MRKIIWRMIEHGEQAGQMAARDAAVNRSDRPFVVTLLTLSALQLVAPSLSLRAPHLVAAVLTLGALQPNASFPNWLGWSG